MEPALGDIVGRGQGRAALEGEVCVVWAPCLEDEPLQVWRVTLETGTPQSRSRHQSPSLVMLQSLQAGREKGR